MCQQEAESPALGPGSTPPKPPRTHYSSSSSSSPFPWRFPICDAHCHPVENMATAQAISSMQARLITVMGTRSQDQDLVVQLAAKHYVQGRSDALDRKDTGVVPAFGWHPWFSFELYDDEVEHPTYNPPAGEGEDNKEAKKKHYRAVLAPDPGEDADFLASLPKPLPLSSFILDTRKRLVAHPRALVGEIGLDKAFRLPEAWIPSHYTERDPTRTPGGRERRRLSSYHVQMQHQRTVLLAQLKLAGEMGRPVSVHGVQVHGILYETLASTWKGHEKEIVSRRKRRLAAPHAEDDSSSEESETPGGKPYPPRICLHSFSGKVELVRQYLHRSVPAKIFFSFSTVVNMSTDSAHNKMMEVVRAVPDDRILIESDLHHAGEKMDEVLEDMYREVCEIKGWDLEEGVNKIAKNYEEFIFG